MDSALMLMQQDTQTQSAAVQTAPGAKARIRPVKGGVQATTFRERLKDCEAMDVWVQILTQSGLMGGGEIKNSMSNDPGSADQGIVGTLEGFGLLDNQAEGYSPVLPGDTLQDGAAMKMPVAGKSSGQAQGGPIREAVIPDTPGEPLPEESAGC